MVNDIGEMERLAQRIADYAYPGFIIGLEGDLGAGKTTFTKFLGRALGIGAPINSPTFTILKIYENDLPLYHIDAYRLEGAEEDLEEYVVTDGVTVIEWYKNIEEMLPEEMLSLHITWVDEEKRLIHMKGTGSYEKIVEAFGD